MTVINSNIPIPARVRSQTARIAVFDLDVGQSVFYARDINETNRELQMKVLVAYRGRARTKHGYMAGARFSSECRIEHGEAGVRVWRID